MNPSLNASLADTIPVAAEAGGAVAPVLSFEAAILIVLVVAVGFLARRVADLGRQVRRLEERLAGSKATPDAVPAAAAPAAELDVEAAVVIAATVAAVWGPSARIVSVGEARSPVRLWALEGRRQIFASHQIR